MNGQKQAKTTITTMNIRVMALNSGQVTPFTSPLTALLRKKLAQTFKYLLLQQQDAISSSRSSCHYGLWTSRFWKSCTIEASGIKRVKDDKVLHFFVDKRI